MTLPVASMTTLEETNPEIKEDSVTLTLHVDDARLILGDLLDYEHVDSLLTIYQEKDSINISIIKKKELIINTQKGQIEDYKLKIENYKKLVDNKDTEIGILLANIEKLKKEVKKQRRQKRWAIASGVAGTVVTAIIMGLTLGN